MENAATFSKFGPLAQWLEQSTHNRLVVGSNPTGATKDYFCSNKLWEKIDKKIVINRRLFYDLLISFIKILVYW